MARVLLRARVCHFGLYVQRQPVRPARRGGVQEEYVLPARQTGGKLKSYRCSQRENVII